MSLTQLTVRVGNGDLYSMFQELNNIAESRKWEFIQLGQREANESWEMRSREVQEEHEAEVKVLTELLVILPEKVAIEVLQALQALGYIPDDSQVETLWTDEVKPHLNRKAQEEMEIQLGDLKARVAEMLGMDLADFDLTEVELG